MGIQINGNTDIISASDGSLTVSGAELPSVTNLNATGIVTASSFSGALAGNVTGNVNATGLSTFSGGLLVGTGASISSPATNVLTLGINNTESVRINSTGVGIGTTNPIFPLHVRGITAARFDKGDTTQIAQVRLRTNQDSYATEWALGQPANSLNFSIAYNNTSSWTEYLRINSSGSVGIGTNESYGDSNASFTSLALGGNGTRYGLIELNKSDGIAGSWIDCYGTGGNGDLRITTAGTTGAITFWTGGEFTEKVRVGAAGSVGIATTSPQTKLHIHNAGWVNNTVGTGGLLLSSVEATGPGIAFRQKEGYYWNLYHGSTSAWVAKGNFGFVWSDGINAASGLSAGITTAGYIVGNRNIIQVVDATTATRVNGAGSFTAITSSSIKCTTNKTRFMISVTCPVNTSDDSDAANTSTTNPYFYGLVERNLNGAGWVTCGGRGSSSQGGYNAHIELSPNRTGSNGTSDYWSGNRYRMEHKYAHFFDDEISPGSNQTIQFRLRVIYQGGENWIQIGEPQGYGADDDYPCQRWGMMIYELGPDASFTMVNTAP